MVVPQVRVGVAAVSREVLDKTEKQASGLGNKEEVVYFLRSRHDFLYSEMNSVA